MSLIPKVGIFNSQGGNVLFLRWEIIYCLISGEYCIIRACCWGISVAYFKKCVTSPVHLLKGLYLKASWVFHLSLNPSRHLSRISPFSRIIKIRYCKNGREWWWEGYGRDDGSDESGYFPLFKGILKDRRERFRIKTKKSLKRALETFMWTR